MPEQTNHEDEIQEYIRTALNNWLISLDKEIQGQWQQIEKTSTFQGDVRIYKHSTHDIQVAVLFDSGHIYISKDKNCFI